MPEELHLLNQSFNSGALKHLEAEILDTLGEDATVKFLNTVKDLGFHYATISGVSWSF